MKFQIDTNKKVIRMEEDIKFSKLISTMKVLFPKGEWKDYTLETNTVINNWTSPIVIKEYPSYPRPSYWWGSNYAVNNGLKTSEYSLSAQNINTSNGKMQAVYNLEVKA